MTQEDKDRQLGKLVRIHAKHQQDLEVIKVELREIGKACRSIGMNLQDDRYEYIDREDIARLNRLADLIEEHNKLAQIIHEESECLSKLGVSGFKI